MKYRPWGEIDWVLSLSSQKDWYFVGVLGTEKRSLCSWSLMKSRELLNGELLIQIGDEEPEKYREISERALRDRHDELGQNGGNSASVEVMQLMSELFRIKKVLANGLAENNSLILDITSMPKRFFFPILRELVQDDNVKNLLVTYSSPESYTDGLLYEDIDGWKNLPGFGGSGADRENLIVSIGFLVESLKGYFSTAPSHGKIKILIPFPAPLPALKRAWESISNIERDHDKNRFEKYRIDTLDLSTAFDYIVSLADQSVDPAAFAPFGPKPISVAMCLYAIQSDSPVYYPQPTIYHPKYSIGIKNNDPSSAVTAYWVKHDGDFLYEI